MAFLCNAAQNAINQYEISSQDHKNCHLKVEKILEDWVKECHKFDCFLKQTWEKVHSIGNKKLILPEELKRMKSFPNIVSEQNKTNSTICSNTVDFFDSKDLIECYDTSIQTSFQVLNPNDDIYVLSPDEADVPVIMPVFDNLTDGVENQILLKTPSCSNQDLLSKTYSIGAEVPIMFNSKHAVYSESPFSIYSENAKTPSDNLGSPSSKSKSFYKSSSTDNLGTPTNQTYSIRQKKRPPLMNCAVLSSTCNENVEDWVKKDHLESVGFTSVSEASEKKDHLEFVDITPVSEASNSNDINSNYNDSHSFVKKLKQKEQHEQVHFESVVFTPESEASDSNFINPNDTDVRMSLIKKTRLAYLEEADALYDNPNDTKKIYSFYPKKHPLPLQITKEPRNKPLSVIMIDKMPCIDVEDLSPEDVDTPDCRLDSIDFKIHSKSIDSSQFITVDQSTQCLHLYNEDLINLAKNKSEIIEDEICIQQQKIDLANSVENVCSKETMFEEKNQHSVQSIPENFTDALPYSRTDNFENLAHDLTTTIPENLTFESKNRNTAYKQSKSLNKKKNFRKKHRKICMPKISKKCVYVDSKYTFISYSNYREKAIDSMDSMCLRKVSKSSVIEIEQSIEKQSLNHIDKKARLENILEVDDSLSNSSKHINNIIEIKDPSFISDKLSKIDSSGDPEKKKILLNSSCNIEQTSQRKNLLNEALKENNLLLNKKTVLLNDLLAKTVHDSSKINDCTVCSINSNHSNSANGSPISNILCGKCICALKGMVKSNVRASKRIAEKSLLIQTLIGNSCKKSKKNLAVIGINLNLDERENKPILNDLSLNSEHFERKSENTLQPVTRSGRYCKPLEPVSISNKKNNYRNSLQFKPELTWKTVNSPGLTSPGYNLRTSRKSCNSSNLVSRKSNSNKSILKKAPTHINLSRNSEQRKFYKLSEKALSHTKTIICQPSPKKGFQRKSVKKKSKSHKSSHVSFIYENHLMVCSEDNLKSPRKRRSKLKKPVSVDSIQVADKAMVGTIDTNMVAFQESCNLQKGSLGYTHDLTNANRSPLRVLRSSKEKRPEMSVHVSFIDKEFIAVNQKKKLHMVQKKPLNKTLKRKSTTGFLGGLSKDGLVSECVDAVTSKDDKTETGKKKRLSISAEKRVTNRLIKARGRRTSLFYIGKRKKSAARASTKPSKIKELGLNVNSPKEKRLTHTRNHTQSLNAEKPTSKKFNKKDANSQNSKRLVEIHRTLPNDGSSKMKIGVKRNAQRSSRKDVENPLVTPALENSFLKTFNDGQEFQTKNLKKSKNDIPFKKTRKNKQAKYYNDNQNALKVEYLSNKIEDVGLRKKEKFEDQQSEEQLRNYEKKDERTESRLFGEKAEIEINSSNDNTNSSTLLNATVIKKSVDEDVPTQIRRFPEGPAKVKFPIDSNVFIDKNILAIPRPFFTKIPAKDVLMKPPVAPKNHNAIINMSTSSTTNISRLSGETTASFIGRKKKTLLNKHGNKIITPDRRRSPLNTMVAQSQENLGKSHTELYQSFIETNGSNISSISRLGGNTAAGNATLGIPETLAQYLEKFNPPPLTFVTQQ